MAAPVARPGLLIGESFSPWTQKACWALERCGVGYRYAEYTPTLSEPALRARLRQWSGPVSVPVMFVHGGRALRGSWEIACHAAASAGGDRLGDLGAAAEWNALSEAALAEARMRVLAGVAADPSAQREALPGFVPPGLRAPMQVVARHAVRRMQRKYGHLEAPGALRHALVRTREGLRASRCDYLLGQFSYADIVMAVVLEAIAPAARTQPPLGPATRRCWSDPVLALEFEDLLDWRGRLAASDATNYSQLRVTA